MPIEQWVHLNRVSAFEDPALRGYVSPFPPRGLMQNVSGLQVERDFASHGADFFLALSKIAPKPLTAFRSILDFGCGCGRLARMFKGYAGRYAGCDVDARHIEWMRQSLGFVEARRSATRPPIPYEAGEFEAVISISIFTHLNEKSQDEFLGELSRVVSDDGVLFLTVHGERALQRAVDEPTIRSMISVPDKAFETARQQFQAGQLAFILQQGHLTTGSPNNILDATQEPFEYGITFTPESYIRNHWSRWFDIVGLHSGALHDFQDVVVLRNKAGAF